MLKRAFTLIELLVVIAIIAILAAILFPVFAQAKASAKAAASISNLKQVALGLQMYATDSDDLVARVYPTTGYMGTDTWVGCIMPYVKNRQIFWDPMRQANLNDSWRDPSDGTNYSWAWIMNYGINHDGYAERYSNGTNLSCTGNYRGGSTGPRVMTEFEDPAARLAVTTTNWGGTPVGWFRFLSWEATWPYDRKINSWSWWNVVYDTTFDYPGRKIPGAFADGHAGKFGKEKFLPQAATTAQRCSMADAQNLWAFWGRPWQ